MDGTVTADGLTVDGSSTVDAITYTANSSFPATGVSLNSNGFSYEMAGTQGKIFRSASNTKALMQITTDGDISFYEDTGTTPKFFWDASAEALGIGTSSPIGSFTVADSGAPIASPASLATMHSSTSSKYFLKLTSADFTENGNWIGLGLGYSSSYLKSAIISEAKDSFGRANLHFALNSATSSDSASLSDSRMVIDYNGNVGIGTTSPVTLKSSTTLQVSGNAKLGDDNGRGLLSLGDIASTGANAGIWRGAAGAYAGTGNFLNLGGYDGITFTTGNADISSQTERMRITSSGDVGIGTSSPSNRLHVYNTASADVGLLESTQSFSTLAFKSSTNSSTVTVGIDGAGNASFENKLAGSNISFVTKASGGSSSEAMRITAGGLMNIGPQSGSGVGRLNISANPDNNYQIEFWNTAGVSVGTITVSGGGTATSYNTSSDYRLKENITDANDAGDKIDAIKVRQYDWKVNGSHQDYGMVAQELLEVAPEAVSGDPESDDMMGVDYSKLVPMLVKEIQSLRARVAQIEGA